MDPVPEFLKQFIIAYSTELFSGLMVLAGVGLWTVARRFRRGAALTRVAETPPGEGKHVVDSDLLLKLSDSLDALNDRVATLESFSDFDRQLGKGARPPKDGAVKD
ncbi:MAG: hypothetical protein ACRELV_01115 [Longimicrobiales bacterium]